MRHLVELHLEDDYYYVSEITTKPLRVITYRGHFFELRLGDKAIPTILTTGERVITHVYDRVEGDALRNLNGMAIVSLVDTRKF
ncbi:hypothetical protein [Microcoleus sp. D2_18a_B4]|uniref:hypothetical protein n=1 Tax=Microcoleus sp. D2_18a_B4 TaxID=3055329 RepID=UPI002FD46893